ncbi:alpha-ketoacid dehydrogenase subunit beta [Candidatus Micrarchaeota archaeon]|nr:alpha-ketoacid dehydrogenase subunit beta [Candidatus Micrarchaeota archaeon]
MAVMNMVDALNSALDNELERDPRVVVLGEDVGRDGGVFRVTQSLLKKYGELRVVDTPLAESAIVGASLGMSLNGLKPVAEVQFDGFTYATFDQLFSHVARMRTRTRGRFTAPLVVRFPYGGLVRALEHHSESPEAFFCHFPGLKVVAPSSPYEAKGLLIAAIRDPDPVIFMEPKRLYRAIKEDVPETPYIIPLGEARVVQEGSDVTIVSYGSMLQSCLEAVKLVAGAASCEVIDLRTLTPWDERTVIDSVGKTGRLVIVHEAPRNCGLGGEIAATIQQKCFYKLSAPIARVTSWDIITPLPKMETRHFPSVSRIAKAIIETATLQ